MLTDTNATLGMIHQAAPVASRKVVIINGEPESLEILEAILDAGHYDIVFVESTERAYSRIKHVRPDLVILCVQADDVEGVQVLSMLKLDAETRGIPVLTHATEGGDPDTDHDSIDPGDEGIFGQKPAIWMN